MTVALEKKIVWALASLIRRNEYLIDIRKEIGKLNEERTDCRII
jgi:hypothetical protein